MSDARDALIAFTMGYISGHAHNDSWSLIKMMVKMTLLFSISFTLQAVLQDEIDEYAKFTCISKEIAELEPYMEYKSLVDVGQGCYVKTVVATPKQSVYLNIGLGFFSELAWPHAMEVVKKREIILQKKLLNVQVAIDQVQSDMREVSIIKFQNFFHSRSIVTFSNPLQNQ